MEPCYHRAEFNDSQQINGKLANSSSLPLSFKQLGMTKKPLPVRKRMFGRAWPFAAPVRDGLVTLWPQLAVNAGSRINVPCFVSFLFLSSLNLILTVFLTLRFHHQILLDLHISLLWFDYETFYIKKKKRNEIFYILFW